MMSSLSRRQFVLGAGSVGLLAGCGTPSWVSRHKALPSPRVYRVGVLTPGPGDSTVMFLDGAHGALVQGLRDHGYEEGKNLALEFRATDQGPERLSELAAELEGLPVDVLIAGPGASVPAMKATTAVPIVFVGGGDPIALGLVPTVARPGGRITGVPAVVQGSDLFGKRLELLRQAVPGLARVAVLEDANANPQWDSGPRVKAAEVLGLQLVPLGVRSPDELASAFAAGAQSQADGLLLIETPLLGRHTRQIAELALQHRIATCSLFRAFVAVGGLMSYGPSIDALYRRSGYFVARILSGTVPADLPIEQPMTFDFVVNMRTARALGITFPHEVALQITEVIE
jgi:putative ABC transport system substrate-binding protein